MAREKKVRMPMSTAGLVMYFDEYKEKIQIKPEYIVYAGFGIAALEILVRMLH